MIGAKRTFSWDITDLVPTVYWKKLDERGQTSKTGFRGAFLIMFKVKYISLR